MSRLDEAAKGVPADTSVADDPKQETDLDLNLGADESGKDSNGEGEQKGDGERSIENVRGELLRKMQKSNSEIMQELKSIREEASKVSKQYGTPAPVPQTSQPQTLDDMSVADLVVMQPNVPDEQKPAFDAYLSERKIDQKVDERLNKFESSTQQKANEDKFNAQAFDRWPDLHKKGSEFYGIADKILSDMGTLADSNPRAVLDAANEAGLELGLSPATGLRLGNSRRQTGNIAPGRSTKGTNAPDIEATEADKAIAHRLGNAMPGRKFSEAQLKRIAKRSKMYKEAINSHVRG